MKQKTYPDQLHVKSCILKGVYSTDSQLYGELYKSLEAPDWAGYNLDALFDILTAEIEGPYQIQWQDFKQVEQQSASMNLQIAALLKEAAGDRPDLTLTFA